MNRLLFFSCSVVLLSACTKSSSPPAAEAARAGAPTNAPTPPQAIERSRSLQHPMKVRWDQVRLSAKEASVVARVTRMAPIAMPLTIRLELPNGAKVTQGRAYIELPANKEADDFMEAYVISYDQLPMHDLILRVTGGDERSGINYGVPYRFGRLPLEMRPPEPAGPPVIINGQNLGSPIPLDSK